MGNKTFIDTDVSETTLETTFVKGKGIPVRTNQMFPNTLKEHHDIKCAIITDARIVGRKIKIILV